MYSYALIIWANTTDRTNLRELDFPISKFANRWWITSYTLFVIFKFVVICVASQMVYSHTISSYRLFAILCKSVQTCESQIVYRWWLNSDLKTLKSANLIHICLGYWWYLHKISKGTNMICLSVKHFYTLFLSHIYAILIFLYSMQE